MQRRCLCVFLAETLVKAHTALLHPVILYSAQFGTLFVGRYFAIPKIHRFL